MAAPSILPLPFRPRFILIAMLCLLLPASFAAAKLDSSYGENEKAGFAFYRLGHLTPRFESWAAAMPAYMKIDPQLRAAFVAEQSQRLQDGYASFDPAVDLIHVRVPGWLRLPNRDTRDTVFRTGGKITAQLQIDNFEYKALPFQIGGNWIAVMPEDVDTALSFPLTESELGDLIKRMNISEAAQMRRASIDLVIRPYAADTRAPATMKGLKVWKLPSHIAAVGLWNHNGQEFVWPVYNAPWYRSETKKELLKLYR